VTLTLSQIEERTAVTGKRQNRKRRLWKRGMDKKPGTRQLLYSRLPLAVYPRLSAGCTGGGCVRTAYGPSYPRGYLTLGALRSRGFGPIRRPTTPLARLEGVGKPVHRGMATDCRLGRAKES